MRLIRTRPVLEMIGVGRTTLWKMVQPGSFPRPVRITERSSGYVPKACHGSREPGEGQVVAEGPMRTQAGKFTSSGDGLCVGYDSGDAVSRQYATPGTFKGGTVFLVGVTVEKTQYLDLEKEAQRVMRVQ